VKEKNLFSFKIKTFIILTTFLLIPKIFLYGFEIRNEIADSISENKIKAGIYFGFTVSTNITNAQGMHASLGGQSTTT
jgi:hypothetical protein